MFAAGFLKNIVVRQDLDSEFVTHSLTHAHYAVWHEGSPLLSVPGQRLDGTPSMLHGLELCLHSSAPGVSWSSPLALSFRCLVRGCASDVLLSPRDVPNPSTSPSHDDSLHAVLIAAGE